MAARGDEAKRAFEACVAAGDDPNTPGLAVFNLVWVNLDLGRPKEARAQLDRLRGVNAELYRNARHLESMIPVEE